MLERSWHWPFVTPMATVCARAILKLSNGLHGPRRRGRYPARARLRKFGARCSSGRNRTRKKSSARPTLQAFGGQWAIVFNCSRGGGMTFGLGPSPSPVTLTHPAIETKLAYILTGEPVKPLRAFVVLIGGSQGNHRP